MKGLFQRKRNPKTPETEPTKPILPEPGASQASDPVTQEPQRMDVGCRQSIGKQRQHNEDALFTLTTYLSTGASSGADPLSIGLFIVADGMGGHQHGEVASDIAVRMMAAHVISKLYIQLLDPKSSAPEESIQETMQMGVQNAHHAITQTVPGGGTTLTAALVLGNQLTIAHVGDSRAYLVHMDGRMEILTRDHSLVKRLVELGQITPEEAAIHPQRNVLYRALGQGEPFEPDVYTMQLPTSASLVLCSDGLWNEVPDEEIFHLVTSSADPQQICQKLVDTANEAGGRDNITAILVRLPG